MKFSHLIIAGMVLSILAFFVTDSPAQEDPTAALNKSFQRILTESQRVWKPSSVEPIITIAAVGDLMMSSWIIDIVNERGVDFPFDGTRHLIESADVAIANLEAPFTKDGERFEDKKYTFKVPPNFVNGIANAGFDVVTMANNHIVDFGCDGILDSFSALEGAGLYHCGAGRNRDEACSPTIVDVNGVKVAFLGFSMTYPDDFWATSARCGTCYPSESLLYNVITQAEEQADLTVVSFHWGAEKHNSPREYQKKFGRLAIDFGADLVLGHHPHVLQGLELYQGKLIAYSLGNYVFASYSNVARTSMVLQAQIDQNGLLMAKVIPINVHNHSINFQPVVFTGERRQQVIDELNEFSLPLNQGRTIINDDGYILPSKVKFSMNSN
jgi:poly-gamma-glutamate synthesis protein (capsule biosynthesis protein)